MRESTREKYGLVTDNSVHKGKSKRQKTDEKAPILRCAFLHQYFE